MPVPSIFMLPSGTESRITAEKEEDTRVGRVGRVARVDKRMDHRSIWNQLRRVCRYSICRFGGPLANYRFSFV